MTILLLIESAGAATFTVDDSGGTDYKKIQDAINVSSDGDTILVYSGTYYETVNVSKQLVLRGIDNGSGKPVVDASGEDSAIKLTAGWSIIEGFTIINGRRNAKCYGMGGGGLFDRRCKDGIYLRSSNNIIRNNTVSNTDDGIYLSRSHNNTLSGNIVRNNNNGIVLAGSEKNTLSGNIARNNNNGIVLSDSDINTLSSNDVSNNEGIGFFLISSSYNTLNNNDINSNKGESILGITIEYSSNIGTGIHIEKYSQNNRIYHNNIINNQVSGNPDDFWDGNYWNDYNGTDANNDGIGDTPYIINSQAKDDYLSTAV